MGYRLLVKIGRIYTQASAKWAKFVRQTGSGLSIFVPLLMEKQEL